MLILLNEVEKMSIEKAAAPFPWLQESGQIPGVGIPQAFGLSRLRLFPVYHPGKRIGKIWRGSSDN
jgi:hypothetical protein